MVAQNEGWDAQRIPRSERRKESEREKGKKRVWRKEEKTRKRSISSIEKRVRLRRDVYIERTRNNP